MTVKLLSAWGNQPPGTLYTSDANTEAAMIAAKVATATLAGAGPWTPPPAPPNVGQSYPIILAQSAIPMILPSSGTMGANGSLTGLTALPYSVFPQPCFMYFPAGKVFIGSPAGMYYASILTTTTAQVYNNMYTSGRPQDAIPVVPTPVVDAGPGAYTQTAGTVNLLVATVPAGIMGLNGAIRFAMQLLFSNSAGNKVLSVNFGGSLVCGNTRTTTANQSYLRMIQNRGALNKQATNLGPEASGTATLDTITAIDTAVDQNLSCSASIASGADFVIACSHIVEVLPG